MERGANNLSLPSLNSMIPKHMALPKVNREILIFGFK
jgi:hypothetical protein